LVKRIPLECDGHDECGPFDIIGDIHGCFDEWLELLTQLGYRVAEAPDRDDGLGYHVQAPANRQLVLLGDLVDRGPRSRECLQLAMAMVRDGIARAVSGNHEAKLLAALRGRRRVHPGSPRARTMAELATAPAALRAELPAFLARLPCHTIFDAGRLVVAHAGINEALQGRISGAVRAFCLYGDTSGERDEQGLMIRRDWAASYRGTALVVYGHCPVARAEWVHNTIDIDTGCVFGGALTALRYPERELVQVAARQRYARPAREFIDKP
jgi:diadenosine tetraphosphatase ApaH/serine/threonine PP2A family protein phosphatase